MIIINNIKELKEQIQIWKKEGASIGLIPTMGYLHDGHRSLIDRARCENDKIIVSTFVNPIQFGINEDLSTYPRSLERDSKLCENSYVDLIFNPSSEEMYGSEFYTYVNVNEITEGLCGAKRPGHFRGVCTVITKLFNIINPKKAYFGEKDAQQLAVIKKMVNDLNFNVEIISCPIIREEDGVAKSSRNSYLSKEERKSAVVLNISLKKAKNLLKEDIVDADTIKLAISEEIKKEPLAKMDYIEVVDSISLKPVKEIRKSVLIALAVFIGKTRLIDNFTWEI